MDMRKPILTQEQEFKAKLVDEIVNCGETVKCHVLYKTHSFCLSDILRDAPMVDCVSAIAQLLCLDRDERVELLALYRRQAEQIVENWLETDFYGKAVLAERIEEYDREMAEEAKEMDIEMRASER